MWSLDDLGAFALDLAKDITGINNFQNSADAFKRAQATANAADGDVGKAISSLPSYVKDIGVGVGQAALGAGTALVNLVPATKARKAADVVSGAITGTAKTAATKAEVLSATASKNVTATAKSADEARAAAQKAAAEAAAAKKAAAEAQVKADNAKTAEAAKKANEAKLKAQQEAKEAAAAKKAADEEAKAAAAAAKKAAEQKAAADKAVAAEKAAAAKAKADAEAKADADAKAQRDAAAKARQDELDAKRKASEDAIAARKADLDAKVKAREEAALKRKADAEAKKKADEDARIAAAKKKADDDAAAAAKKKADEEAAGVGGKTVTPKVADPNVVTPPPGEEEPPPPPGDEPPPPGDEPPPPGDEPPPGGDDGGDDDGEDTPAATDSFDKTWLILRAKLIAAGLPTKTVDDSVTYFRTIIKDGTFSGDTEINDIVDQYLYLPTYKTKAGTEVESPYYRDFGSYNNQLKVPKQPKELVPLVLGYARLVDKYQVNAKFGERESIQKYLQNDVSVSELDERMNASRLRGLSADPNYLKALTDMGYITGGADLTSFFLDPGIGTIELESRRKTAAFATEAVRRSNAGIKLDTASAQATAARLTALGYSEAQVSNLAGEGYENIAQQLNPVTALSGMYEKTGESASALAPVIQKELESEQFLGMASQRRKKLAEQNIKAFQGQSGMSRFGLGSGSASSLI